MSKNTYMEDGRKTKKMKNGKTHPWRARSGTTKEHLSGTLNAEKIIPFTCNMGVRK